MIYNSAKKEIKKLEEKAYKLNPKDTEILNAYYYGDYNSRTGDVSPYYYEMQLKEIIIKEVLKQ